MLADAGDASCDRGIPGLLKQERETHHMPRLPACSLSTQSPPATRRSLFPEGEETGNGKISRSQGSTRGSVFSIVLCEFSLKVNG